MKKQQNYDDAANALNFVESCEKTCAHLEMWCEQQVLRYTGESWPKGYAAEQMKPSLQAYVNAAVNRQIRTRDNAENFAWRVAVAKFAERLADRYGIELTFKNNRTMKAKQIIETILDNCLDNSKCGFVIFDKDEDLKEQVERIFGHPTCYCSLATDVEYLWYWPGGQAENVFVYADAGISIEVDGEIDQIYLMKVEDGKMNYEKKYKEMKARVLEIGRGYVKGVDFSKPRQIAEYIDPELKESGKINNK